MSSQDSEEEIYVADDRANSRINGDLEPYDWTTDEEEDYEPKGKEQTSSDEEEAPLPQPANTHVEFKKSSLPNSRKSLRPCLSLLVFCRRVSRNFAIEC